MAVDTLKLYERFRKASLQDEAAKEIAEAFREANDDLSERLATREDLKLEIARPATKQDIDLKIEVLRKETSDLRAELIKWMLGIGIGAFTALLGLLRILKVI